jgi:hypothetical protein
VAAVVAFATIVGDVAGWQADTADIGEIMTRHENRRHVPRTARLLIALCALVGAAPAQAAVAILSEDAAPVLVLVDADRLDPPLLARLVTAGFGSAHQFETGCEVVDAGLLADRLRRARRVVALLAPGDASLVQEIWRQLGGRLGLGGPSESLPPELPVDLRDLRAAMGDAAKGLHALEGARAVTGATVGVP